MIDIVSWGWFIFGLTILVWPFAILWFRTFCGQPPDESMQDFWVKVWQYTLWFQRQRLFFFFFPCFLPSKPALKLVDSVRKVRWLNNVEHMVIRGGFRSAEYTCFLFFEHHKLWSKLAGAVFVQNLTTSAEKMIWLLSLVVSAVVLMMTIW